MAEVAGLVLGGIPLAVWALERYVEPFEAFHEYRTSIETFRTDLILQNRQLHTTFCNVGLGKEPSSEELRECFDSKFPSISRELMSIPKALPDRAQWEWRRVKHSFSTKKRNKVIEDLRRWNEDLRRSLEKPEVPAEDDSGKVRDLKRRFNIQRSNSIRQCLSSLHRALETGFRCACSPPHQAAVDLDWAAYESDTAETLKVAVSYRTISQSPQRPDPSPASSLRSRMVYMFRSLSRTPSPPPIPPDLSSVSTAVPASASTEITNLCDAVCTECNPRPLAGFLKDTQTSNKRFGIAASIAWSVLHLSGSPWLGDHWDEKQANIFLERTQGDREMLSRNPCALCIFSSPTTPEEPLTNDFIHLIPNRIVFGLGILLIELCINKSFAEIRQTDESAMAASLLDDYQTALSKLDEVYRLAGDSYGDAAARCVKLEFQGRDLYKNFDFSQFRRQFYDAVVAPVQATYLMFPDSRIPV
ncbi:uncharacterized protein NFIA_005990 [Aspergillus fischeri NRRL 181]|uniref:DUF7580 domain-containing protein n=1 Tax=Neosartorya fischeri (strain ATCC 1020 / DSM 3700 / CBS 544.65 / FGSC A1164 / JCM 1740 / NRRL 181 / WB 181) TaxID=331117 RepID=A1DKJ6_NEOFI|nr:uncharacterized protein NFIA_005990 [Aspergillus fischeri NRRL 181]EAW17235.1 hypothetical protein NFIA_005990 [Aspergillus fischeri NRRL 181]